MSKYPPDEPSGSVGFDEDDRPLLKSTSRQSSPQTKRKNGRILSLKPSRSRLILIVSALVLVSIALFNPLSPLSPTSSSWSRPSFPTFDDEEWTYGGDAHFGAANQTRGKRVAIIGAGASGSSAAWFLSRAGKIVEERLGKDKGAVLEEIVVFEKSDYVGGRTHVVYPHGDENLRAIELGASIFVDANRHLVKAAERYGLRTINPDFGESGVGIWDGTEFLYTSNPSKSWFSSVFDTVSAIRRYGPMSPFRTRNAVKELLNRFANLYHPTWLAEHGPAVDIDDFVERVGLGREYTTRTGDEWALDAVGVGEKWMSEIMEGSTRVNYASDMAHIHALGSAVSMATGGAQAVEGGNWQIFQGLMNESEATLHLSEEVTDIKPINAFGEPPQFRVSTKTVSSGERKGYEPFDQIFFATPWFSSPKDYGMHGLQTNLLETVQPQRYVNLHVTLFTTTKKRPEPTFFGLPDKYVIPDTVLTTGIRSRQVPPVPPPMFQSITWHGETREGSGEYVVKIFSLTYLKDQFIHSLIDEEPTWLLRKEWYSYPELRPTTTWPPVEPVKGVQYLAALEPWISTMETQTLSAREAVARVVQDWWGLGYGECRGGADAWDWSCEE